MRIAALLDAVAIYAQGISITWDDETESIAVTVGVGVGENPFGDKVRAVFRVDSTGTENTSEILGRVLVEAATWIRSKGRTVDTGDVEEAEVDRAHDPTDAEEPAF